MTDQDAKPVKSQILLVAGKPSIEWAGTGHPRKSTYVAPTEHIIHIVRTVAKVEVRLSTVDDSTKEMKAQSIRRATEDQLGTAKEAEGLSFGSFVPSAARNRNSARLESGVEKQGATCRQLATCPCAGDASSGPGTVSPPHIVDESLVAPPALANVGDVG